ncbi:MAG: hypothetical protein J0I41_23410 [Filimonas sp.]|nr:hypothetical protein [Filimonas sp.]
MKLTEEQIAISLFSGNVKTNAIKLMDKRLELFWNELLAECELNKNFEFIFKIEYWGILWMPWFIYLDDRSLSFSVNDISEDDLNTLISLGLIEFIEEIPSNDTLDIITKKYRIKSSYHSV